MAHLSELDTQHTYQASVRQNRRLTPPDADEIREIILEVSSDFTYQVNQSFGVLIQATGEFGNQFHHRLYSIADLPAHDNGKQLLTILVKRCFYVDEFNGERYPGLASNFLCDRKPGDSITLTGPHSLPFIVPDDKTANLILVSMGTGIAPFRAFIKHIYQNVKDWHGRIRLFYGARTGLELLYLNDKDGDLTQYYDEATFQAFHALSPRPHWADPIALDAALEAQAAELQEMLNQVNTYVYVAGFAQILPMLDKAFANILGSKDKWSARKAELVAGNKWAEVVY